MWHKQKLEPFKGPLFKKVIQLIEYYIEQGILISGEKLLSERELAKQLQVNRSTIVHALNLLTERGVLIRKRGSGTYINNQKWGVQVYSTINWRLPRHFYQNKQTLYQQKIDKIRNSKNQIYDLANGDLPTDLIPKLHLPNISSQELIMHEKQSDLMQLGLPSLKEQIANYMKTCFAMKVNRDEILITSGTQQSLFLITQGLLKPGDAIGIESPSYFYSLPLFQAAGLRLYGIECDHQGIVLESLTKVVEQHQVKWLFLNPVFQNPMGFVMSDKRKKRILDFCRSQCIGIVEDDAYSNLAFKNNLAISPIKKFDNSDQVIYLGSLSKYIGRNIRIGWMIAPRTVIENLAKIRQHIDSGLSILPQLLAEQYLQNHYLAHQQLLRHKLKCRSEQLIDWLNSKFNGEITYQVSLGGFHLYANLPVTNPVQELMFLNQLLSQGMIVAQGSDFGDSLGKVRLSYGHFIQNLI
ncbi:PLP-dependent aminotransferase family protein [Gilliamella sp. B2840]|uniref:aminotransferase-like domain-containing protein n=1 Tax=unclassified Gilliamella TaxID=2685620 RepID=UPI00226A6B0D|nr:MULTISPECIES: PLP-dependent aminotransferase family protein [unclassified Gilliamella]MCX8656797.1 PLP-dependent aminotransferase family protein [Gilliamella sp. B2894]MCX8665459.1 PLP-dependent aminotransferase family protein [Gilliamella sp. B2887]MCX8694197.1 PLP-dependent aminotransferase family protein [Gilliamella sp. B2881]MCX8696720.1 PLP-dependent aminotransferase family protein [Gilliamella sp. B2828]MCX8699303.1 PLP-dependent aminotransferase family protein [Gilliamella sp. B3000